MASFEQEFQIWTMTPFDEDSWLLQRVTKDLADAKECFNELSSAGQVVAMYEKGAYTHKKKTKIGLVAFD